MNNYDRINVYKFRNGDIDGFLCSLCGQSVTKEESVSFKGYNLVCNKCAVKVTKIFGIDDYLDRIHVKGKQNKELCGF